MSRKQRYVTESEKREMYRLYQELGTFKAVAEKLKRSPDTVSRHVHAYEAAVGAAGYIQDIKVKVV